MALVRLETQHHPAGELRPATPTCCCCCCAGATVGSIVAMSMLISTPRDRREALPKEARPSTPAEPGWEPDEMDLFPRIPLTRDVIIRILLAASASILVLLFWLTQTWSGISELSFGLSFYVVLATLLIVPLLGVGASIRLHHAGASLRPISLFVIIGFPMALVLEFFLTVALPFPLVWLIMVPAMIGIGVLIRRSPSR